MLGMRHEDALGPCLRRAPLPACIRTIRRCVRENLDRCISEKREKYELEYRLPKGKREYIWVKTKVSVIQCDGDCVRVYADYHDVTAEKKVKDSCASSIRSRYTSTISWLDRML